MMVRSTLLLCLLLSLIGCSKAPDLDAPCKNFGQHCATAPINISPLS